MIEKIRPFTEKFPFLYQVYLKDYIIETTNKENFDKLMTYLKENCTDDFYMHLPANKRMTIEIHYDVKQIRLTF